MILVIGAIAFVSFLMCYKGFSEEGLPLSKDKNLTGKTAQVIGTTCGVFGLACVGFIIMMCMKIAEHSN